LNVYKGIGLHFKGGHGYVRHSIHEYVRDDASTNTVESFFALMKRSLHGIYHSVSREHLPRYLAERAFTFNNRRLEGGGTVRASHQRRNRQTSDIQGGCWVVSHELHKRIRDDIDRRWAGRAFHSHDCLRQSPCSKHGASDGSATRPRPIVGGRRRLSG
jgi:ISXO2-like transposase domain